MKSTLVVVILALAFTAGVFAADAPVWPHAIPPAAPAANPAPPDTSLKSLPGSTLKFTRQQISDAFGPADWYPNDHPPLPDVVAHGRKPDVRA